MVERAAAFNAKRINFVITHYFVDEDGDLEPDWYCLREDQDASCEKFGAGDRLTFQQRTCLQHLEGHACSPMVVRIQKSALPWPHVVCSGVQAGSMRTW
jgi:hypothetical protein